MTKHRVFAYIVAWFWALLPTIGYLFLGMSFEKAVLFGLALTILEGEAVRWEVNDD